MTTIVAVLNGHKQRTENSVSISEVAENFVSRNKTAREISALRAASKRSKGTVGLFNVMAVLNNITSEEVYVIFIGL